MESLIQRNRLTLTAVVVVAIYVVIALSTRVVVLGIFPMLLSFRAFRRGEPLAPVALVAALLAVGIAVAHLSHN